MSAAMNTTPSSSSPLAAILLACVTLGAITGQAAAQCELTGTPITHTPDGDGPVVVSAAWDPDGAGPQPELVVLGGSFQVLGAAARGLVTYDPVAREYGTLGTGIAMSSSGTPTIAAILVLSNHDLVVAGTFSSIDGVAANNVARWNGTAWQPMGSGLPHAPLALAALPNGDVVAGGGYTFVDPVQRWNGTAWLPLGTGLVGTVRTLLTLPNGDLLAGGHDLIGTTHLVRWNGSSWSTFAGGTNEDVWALLPLPNGDLVAAGLFTAAGGVAASGIARWNGTTWSAFGSGMTDPPWVFTVARLPNGDLVAGGEFSTAGGVTVDKVARWNGTSWTNMGAGFTSVWPDPSTVSTMHALANGDVLAGGSFVAPDGSSRIARFDGVAWTAPRIGTFDTVFDARELANGDRIAVGDFTTIEGVPAARVARQTASGWQALGSGIDDGTVEAVLELPNGDIVVGGTFTSAGGVAANRIARWDGAAWHALGAGLPATVQDLAFDAATGEVLAAGAFVDRVARWDGLRWHGTGIAGSALLLFGPRRMLTTRDGRLFVHLASHVAQWIGGTWVPQTTNTLGGAWDGQVIELPNGDLLANNLGQVRRWNGTVWSNLPTAPWQIGAMLALPDGDVLIGSRTVGATAAGQRFARWDGTAWNLLGGLSTGVVSRLRWLDDGRVLATGTFTRLLDVSTAGYGELASTCAAAAANQGAGCAGSGGPNQLTATSLPWIDATYTSVATGLPTTSLAVEVYGLGTTALALDSVLPEALPGCVLTATPDLLRLHVPQAGTVSMALAIPNTPSFVGSTWYQQVVPFGVDSQGAIVEITASNSLQLSLGAF